MFESYKHLIIAVVVIFVLHRFVVNKIVENMAPIGHVNMPHWIPGQEILTPQDIIDLRNNKFECNKKNKLGCNNYGQAIPMNFVDEYKSRHYNPAHLDPATHESQYTAHVGDKGQPGPDEFAGVTYN